MQKLIDLRTAIADLEKQIAPINERITAARNAIKKAKQPSVEIERLTEQRRNILADTFLGKEGASTADVDQQLADARRQAEEAQPIIDGATLAIQQLEAQRHGIAMQIHELSELMPVAKWETLRESLPTLVSEYEQAAKQLASAYARIVGQARACDHLVSPVNGLPFSGAFVANAVEIPAPNCTGIGKANFYFDMTGEIAAARDEALKTIS